MRPREGSRMPKVCQRNLSAKARQIPSAGHNPDDARTVSHHVSFLIWAAIAPGLDSIANSIRSAISLAVLGMAYQRIHAAGSQCPVVAVLTRASARLR